MTLRAAYTLLVPAVLLSLSTGCDAVSMSGPPEEARVQVTGPAGETVRVVTSTHFALGGFEDGGVQLIEADTAEVQLPYDQVHSLAPTYWFVVRVLPPEEGSATLSLNVHVSGRQPYEETQTLAAGQESFLQYYFRYQ